MQVALAQGHSVAQRRKHGVKLPQVSRMANATVSVTAEAGKSFRIFGAIRQVLGEYSAADPA
jgi:hypothetical protein